ncbi:MAG: hypothetical protein HQK77_12370 [Desulfobacterales bacterium]|nr:hypothetical protein [Desulfobacterales bacterium]
MFSTNNTNIKKLKFKYVNFIWYYFLITFVTMFICYPLFKKGYYFVTHEGISPLYRTYGVSEAISNGQFPAKVLPNLINGMGYGWSIFYSPLSYDISSLFNLMGLHVLTSVKLVHMLEIFLSGIFMYVLMNRVTKSSIVAITASVLYLAAPYRIVDIYIRNAFAESLAFTILPIIFLGLYEIVHGNKNRWWILGIGMGTMFITHNITAIYSSFFVIIYLGLNFKNEYRNKLFYFVCVKAMILALLLSSYFLLPLLEHKYYGNYAIFSGNFSSSDPEFVHQHSVKFLQFFKHDFYYGISKYLSEIDNDEMPYLIGFPLLFFSFIGCFMIHKCKFFFNFCFLSAIFLVFIMTPFFPWHLMPKILLYIQFPWRLLLFTSFFLSTVGGFALVNVTGNWKQLACITLLSFLLCIYIYPFIHPNYKLVSVNEIQAKEDITNTTSIGHSIGEYLPIAVKIDYLKQRDQNITVIEGKAIIDILNWNGLKIQFRIKPENKKLTIEIPLIYYLGYKAIITKIDGSKQNLKVNQSPNGLLTVHPQDEGIVTIWYGWTKLSIIGNILTIIGILWLLYLVILSMIGNKIDKHRIYNS